MGGNRTSLGGRVLERVIQSLHLLGFEQNKFGDRRLIANYPYETIYGTPGRYEWMIADGNERCIVECKFQNFSGSTDEKLPYILENFKESSVDNMVVVYGGSHWDSERGSGAIEWLRRQARALADDSGKKLFVLTIEQFMEWAKETFPPVETKN